MSRSTVISAILAFVASRILILCLVIIGSQIAFVQKVFSNSVWETRITIERARILPELSRVAMVGDAWSYETIAVSGYPQRTSGRQASVIWAFFPLYPLLVRWCAAVGSFAVVGMLISNVALLLALLLLGPLARANGIDDAGAARVVFYAAFFPTSYFLSCPLPESLFLLLAIGCFLAAQRDQWWLAAMLGMLASATRVTGIFLVPALVIIALEHRTRRAWPIIFAPAGLAAFMLLLHFRTGNVFAFIEAQSLWHRRPTAFVTPLFEYLRHPSQVGMSWNLATFNFLAAMLLLVAALACLRRKQWAFAAYTLLVVIIPLSTGSLQSIGRYALGAFPLFVWLAKVGARPLADRLILTASALLLGWLVAFATLKVDFALA